MPGKYQPLADWLAAQAGAITTITLTFADIERVLGAPLPPIARVTTSWWSSPPPHAVQAQAWRTVGWGVSAVDCRQRLVTFRRTSSPS